MVQILNKIKGERISLVIDKFVPEDKIKGYVPAILYHVVLNKNNEIIGHCSARVGWNESMYYCGHIGYSINEEYRGNGYAVEAVNLIKKVFKVNNIGVVYITNSPDNHASIRVCEKLGAKFVERREFSEQDLKRLASEDSFKNIWKLRL